MAEPSRTTERLLEAAEHRVRTGGYNGFSFRELAADIGIKSASVHHHFPTKEDLVKRLVDRYTDRFMAALAQAPKGSERLTAYRTAFRDSITVDGEMCLCGLLGAESGGLPDSVTDGTRRFFARAIDHLAEGLRGEAADPRQAATAALALLEGASVLARAFDDVAFFDEATATLEANLVRA